MNTIDKETNTEISKPVTLICLCCKRKTIVFKKLHENFPNELPHVMCLLCYQYVIKDMGYDFVLNALNLMLSFQSLTGFNVIFANKQDFNTLLQKIFITVIISPSTFVNSAKRL